MKMSQKVQNRVSLSLCTAWNNKNMTFWTFLTCFMRFPQILPLSYLFLCWETLCTEIYWNQITLIMISYLFKTWSHPRLSSVGLHNMIQWYICTCTVFLMHWYLYIFPLLWQHWMSKCYSSNAVLLDYVMLM